MKGLLNTVCCCLLVLLMLSSCNNENSTIEQAAENTPQFEDFQYCFDNPDNPYESAGIQHNLGLDALAASPNFPNISIEEAHNIAFKTIAANLGLTEEGPYDLIAEVYEPDDTSIPLVTAGKSLLAGGFISEQAFNDILSLKKIINNSPNPEAYGNSILALEDEIMGNTNYTTFELEVLLGGTSIARHSMCYWISAYVNVDNPWHTELHNYLSDDTALARGDFFKDLGEGLKKIVEGIGQLVEKDVDGYKKTEAFLKKGAEHQIEVNGLLVFVISTAGGVVYSFFPS